MVVAPFARLREASLQKEHPVHHRIEARTGDTRKETSSCAFPHQHKDGGNCQSEGFCPDLGEHSGDEWGSNEAKSIFNKVAQKVLELNPYAVAEYR